MTISEPVTMLTDYLLGLLATGLAWRVWKVARRKGEKSLLLWSIALMFLALGAFVGGSAHGFALHLSETGNAVLWKMTVFSVGLASFSMLTGTTLASVGNPAQRIILGMAALQLAAYSVWMIGHNAFIFVVYDYAPAMIAIVVLQAAAFRNRSQASAPWLIGGVLVSFVAAGIQVSGFDLHTYFNHNDFYHVVQMAGVYLLYRGAVLLSDI